MWMKAVRLAPLRLAARKADWLGIGSLELDVYGSPRALSVGDPAALGIADLARPDYGEAVELRAGEVPVFWACGVTPQAALIAARPEVFVTHAPGCMLVTDRLNTELAAF
jgi:uncharacterized protein YcsI (UPF0317 family)